MQLRELKIRRAQPEEATLLTQIAHDAKRYWGYPEKWLEYWRDELTVRREFLEANLVYVAECESKVVGFYGLVIEEQKASLEHLWIAPEYIGLGIGKQLFVHSMQMAANRNAAEVEIVADPNAEGFYERMGATVVGQQVSEIEGQPRIIPRMKATPGS